MNYTPEIVINVKVYFNSLALENLSQSQYDIHNLSLKMWLIYKKNNISFILKITTILDFNIKLLTSNLCNISSQFFQSCRDLDLFLATWRQCDRRPQAHVVTLQS